LPRNYYFREIDHLYQVANNPAIERNQGIIVKTPLLRTAACLSIGMALSLPCLGGDTATGSDSAFSLSGFGTIGLARSTRDGAEYVRDLSQPHGLTKDWTGKVDTVLGVQANLKLGAQTEGVMQVMSRYRYDGSFTPEVSWAFLSHEFSPDFQARIGRLGTEFYMLSDSRLIGYSNLTVRPPPDFFVPLIFSYFDGADITASTKVGSALLRGKLFYGRSPETSPFYGPITWDVSGSRLYGGHLDLFTGPWQFRIGRSAVRFSDNELPMNSLIPAGVLPPGADITTLIPDLSTVHKTAVFDSLGVVYDSGPLRVQGMLGRIAHETKSYEDSVAGFVIGSYRIGAFTPYLGYSRVKSSTNTIPLPGPLAPLAPVVSQVLAYPHMDQHTITLGTRWDFRQNLALKAQLDFVRGSRNSLMTFRGSDDVVWNGRMNVLSVALDFAF
jgi:hypothetical protein